MRISVIIPTYNRADMVAGAVESVLAQTMDEVEIIVVDDGSTDDTAQVLAPFMHRIVYLRRENEGPAGARNTGMRAARGNYIAYLDSDDLYRPFKLALQCGLLDRHPEVGMVYTESSAFDDQGYYDEWHLRKYHSSAYARGGVSYDSIFSSSVPLADTTYGRAALAESHPEWLSRKSWFGEIYEQYLFNTLVFTNNMVFRRSLLDNVGLQEPRFGLFHDLEFALRLCKAASVAFIDVPTYLLRYHPGQISGSLGPTGAKIWISKQKCLLRVFRAHTRPQRRPSDISRDQIAMRTTRLCRAVAIPMLAYDQGGTHRDRYYTRCARRYLRVCARAGKPERLLWLLSFTPHLLRRIGFKLISLAEKRRGE